MKIYKKKDLAFSIHPFGAAGKSMLGLAAMAFFDLTAPDALLTEQDLWKAVPGELGAVPILDAGMPKIRGEVLAAGAACAPRGQTVQGLNCRVRVGDVDKSLHVFGDRYWMPDGTVSQPRAFQKLPITWENAFGGPDLPDNPGGKGMAGLALPDGNVAVPLPNVEHPGRMVAARDDRPDPAGFGQLDITWPRRSRYNGTYDERWKAERWPGLPDDTNFLLFNCAQEDQWIPGFFRGDEPFLIENMHQDMPRISGSLPGLRARMFITLLDGYRLFADPSTFKETFIEVTARLETVWLFPGILRGVAIYRGAVENADDEGRDAVRAYLEWEKLSDPPGTIDDYAEKQRQAMDRGAAIDMAPFQAAGKKMAQTLKMVKNSPKVMAGIKASVAGKVPVMPVTPEEMAAKAGQVAAGNLATIDKLEAVARDLHGRFGHMAEIDLGRFDTLRDTVRKALSRAQQAAGKVDDALVKANARKAEALAQSKELVGKALDPANLAAKGASMEAVAKVGFDPNFSVDLDGPKGPPFHEGGFPFVVACRRALRDDYETKNALKRLGIPDRVMGKAWLGVNPYPSVQKAADWGLPVKPGEEGRTFEIPAGLVLPRFDGPHLNRVMVRPLSLPADAYMDYAVTGTDVVSEGSDASALDLPAPAPGGCWVIVADELQALFMEEEIGDACGVLALAAPTAKPGPDAAKEAASAPAVAIVLPAGTSLSSEEWTAWKAAWKNGVPVVLPEGRTVFESRAKGADIRALVMDALPKDFARKHALEAELPEPGSPVKASPVPPLSFPDLGIGAAVAEAMAAAQAKAAPIKAGLEAFKQKAESDLAAEAAKHGKTLEQVMGDAAADAGKSPAERTAGVVDKMVAEKKRLQSLNALTPEAEARFDEGIAKTQATIDKAEAQYQAGMAKIESAKGTFADAKAKIAAKTIPGMTPEQMKAAGLDPEAARVMTREEVVERYEAGLSFKRRNLTGVDLSGLELPGIDLSEAILKKTVFTGCKLDGAKFKKAIAADADFTKASMKDSDLTMGLFMKAKLRKADLSRANLKQTLLQGADLEKSVLDGARLHMVIVSDAKLKKARFTDASLSLCVIERSDLAKADFRQATLRKSVLRALEMDRTDFSGANLSTATLSGVKGRKLSFAGADMTKFRVGKDSKLAGTDFTKANLSQACLRESDLSGSDFRGARLDRARIDMCDAKGANLNRVSAKRASILKTDLAGADLFGINLFMGSLRKSRLAGTNLGRSNLYAVDFYKSVIGETDFSGANMKRSLLAGKADLVS